MWLYCVPYCKHTHQGEGVNPCFLALSLTKALERIPKLIMAMCVTSLVLLQAIKCAIFENLSTTTKMESLFLSVFGKPRIKSMLI